MKKGTRAIYKDDNGDKITVELLEDATRNLVTVKRVNADVFSYVNQTGSVVVGGYFFANVKKLTPMA